MITYFKINNIFKDLNQMTENINGSMFLVKLLLDFGFLLRDLRTKSKL